jgi:hypothetical protein
VAPLKRVPAGPSLAAAPSLAAELAGLLPHKAPASGKTAPGESIPELGPTATKRRPRTAAARSTTPTRTTTTARASAKPRQAPAKSNV